MRDVLPTSEEIRALMDDLLVTASPPTGATRVLLPIEEWLLAAPDGVRQALHVSSAEADRIVRLFAEQRGNTSRAVLLFAREHASRDVKRELFDRLLRSPDGMTRCRALTHALPGGQPASVEALEDALALTLAEATPHARSLWLLARCLQQRRPSEQLIPAVRLLLGSTAHVLDGIRLARALGQEALVGDLVPLLDSMDVELRHAAREAVAHIREITRVKREAAAWVEGDLLGDER